MEKFSGTVELISVSLLEKTQYPCMPMTYVFPFMRERKTECQFDK